MKKTKRAFAYLFILVLIVGSLAACEQKTDNRPANSNQTNQENDAKDNENSENDSSNGSSESQQEGDWSWPLPEQKELSMWITWSSEYANSPNELVAIKEIENITNVHVNWVTVSSNEAQEKFGLMMASGDYPDILRQAEAYYTGGLVQACTDGIIYDLTEYVPKYMPVYQSIRTMNEKLMKDTVTDDGRMVGVYTIASENGVVSGERPFDGLSVRQDWLDDLGLEAPVTIEDWHTVLTAFKENYDTCDAPLLIGANNGYDICNNFLSAYGVLGEFYNDNGTVKYGPLEDGYKQWVQLFHDWYAEGLIDPNFINNDATFAGSADYIGTGRAGACANYWGGTADSNKISGYTDDEDYFLSGVTTPVLNEGDTPQIGYAMSELTKETLCITNNCKDIELACRWLDYWYTEECMFLDSLGIEGDSYVNNGDGTYSLTQKLKDQVTNGEYPSLYTAIGMYVLATCDFGLYNWAMFNPMSEGNRAMEAYDAWEKASYDLLLPPCRTMTEEETIAYNNLYVSIQTLVQENTIKFITGARPMEEYDNFVTDLKGYGIEDCIKYQQAAFDRYNAR